MTSFADLSGSYLTMTSRLVCRVCFHEGVRGPKQYIMNPEIARWKYHTRFRPAADNPAWKREMVRLTKAHYARKHPDIHLPA